MPIIPLSDVTLQARTWQWHVSNAVRDTRQLAALLDLDIDSIDSTTGFPLLVPLPYIERMERGNPDDPLLRQVLPLEVENRIVAGYTLDPLRETSTVPAMPGESVATGARGLLQKYQGRALVIATGACGINCRYCFRRHYPYSTQQADWEAIEQHLAADPTVSEIILSGGDPLVMNDRQLGRLITMLNSIDHVTTLRIHSRLPVVIPQRVCDDMLEWIHQTRKQVVLVTHINHANEIDDQVMHAMARLRSAGVTLLNQSVLLAGVNDSPAALLDLSRRLFECNILPYYLHLLDPVAGAAHFNVSEEQGLSLVAYLRNNLPGYLVPELVREMPGASAKQPVTGLPDKR